MKARHTLHDKEQRDVKQHAKSNLLFAKNLRTGLQTLFLLHFGEWKQPLQLL